MENALLSEQTFLRAHRGEPHEVAQKAWSRLKESGAFREWPLSKKSPWKQWSRFTVPARADVADGACAVADADVIFANGVLLFSRLNVNLTIKPFSLISDNRPTYDFFTPTVESIACLHEAYSNNGFEFLVPAHTQNERFVVESRITEDRCAIFPKFVARAAANSTCEMEFRFQGDDAFFLPIIEVHAEKNACVKVILKDTLTQGCVAGLYLLYVNEAAHVQVYADSRSKDVRCVCAIFMDGADGRADVRARSQVQDTYDFRVLQQHRAPNTSSSVNVRTAVNADGYAVVDGKIVVDKNSTGCVASHKSDHLLLAETASAAAQPALEVANNDVQCAHGSALHPVDQDVLFYMLTRGIEENKARRMIVEGFLSDN